MLIILKQYRGFFIPFLVFMAFGAMILASFEKAEIHLYLNQFHSHPTDLVMPYLTWLGDGWFVTGLTVIFLAVRYKTALMLTVANLTASGVTQILKNYVFDDHDRPAAFFNGVATLHLVPGLEVYHHYSFPSGHTTLAFATCAVLASLKQNFGWQLLCFLAALFVGYTRVYLSQHFFNDIYAGAAIGSVIAGVTIWAVTKFGGPKLEGALFRN